MNNIMIYIPRKTIRFGCVYFSESRQIWKNYSTIKEVKYIILQLLLLYVCLKYNQYLDKAKIEISNLSFEINLKFNNCILKCVQILLPFCIQ
jgi:hypothetical protein